MVVPQLFRILLFALVPGLFAAVIPTAEYRARRAELRKALGDSVTILFGRTEREGGDALSRFRQESNFYYLTGLDRPGAILVLAGDQEWLFLPRRNETQQRWTGPQLSPATEGVRDLTGFANVAESESFEVKLPQLASAGLKIFALPADPKADALRRLLPLREFADAALPIARLRMKKSQTEIELIQRATDATLEAHRAAWRRMQPGLAEYQIAATMTGTYFEKGCEADAYPPIVGAGPSGVILHYYKNNRTIDRGELVLMDVGGSCSMYASDITRTIPASGKFTARQRELYEIVVGAQRAAIGAVKPGATLGRTTPNSLYKVALDYLNAHGKDRNGGSLGKYFTHGIGHHVGLDVHDAFDPALPLAAGMVITIEPGLYLPDEGIGIRVEDMVLVTEKGHTVLSSSLPKEAGEIEKLLAGRR